MNLLTAENISKSYTDKILLKQVSFGIQEGDRIGVIGVNGTGKSTFLKILAGVEEPEEGSITKGGRVSVEYLSQNPEFDQSLSILENVLKNKKAKESHWNLEGQARSMLEKFGISDGDGKIDVLSGGQKKRIALVRTLLTPADILVLDEPTNHLDNEMGQWLEIYLKQWRGAFIMVTHDRYFLDKVTNRIVEIDNGNLYSYSAGYQGFLELKAQREEMEEAAERKKKSLYRKDLEWMMRGARARSTKQKAHIQRFEELKNREKLQEAETVDINAISSRLGKKTVEVSNVTKGYGEKVLIKDFSYIFLKGDRIGIIGPNGCGKSTLLKLICGIEKPDQGEVIKGETVKIGYFSQENEYMDESRKVLDYIRDTAEYIKTADGEATASQMCERFLFDGALKHTVIQKLSGGEKRRLYLLKVLMEAPNVLILDEPSNDLDIPTLTVLEEYLDTYDGIVVTVSHDRYFLDRVVERMFHFEGKGHLKQYEGGYTDYLAAKGMGNDSLEPAVQDKSSGKKPARSNDWKQNRPVKLKFSYMEEKEYAHIDEEIEELEKRIEGLDNEMMENSTNSARLSELMKEKEKEEERLEEKMDRWVYLNDLAEQIKAEREEERNL